MGDSIRRENPDLDAALDDDFGAGPAKKTKRRAGRRKPLQKDHVRRLAFRVLALLSGHDEPTRARVLAHAAKLNRG